MYEWGSFAVWAEKVQCFSFLGSCWGRKMVNVQIQAANVAKVGALAEVKIDLSQVASLVAFQVFCSQV